MNSLKAIHFVRMVKVKEVRNTRPTLRPSSTYWTDRSGTTSLYCFLDYEMWIHFIDIIYDLRRINKKIHRKLQLYTLYHQRKQEFLIRPWFRRICWTKCIHATYWANFWNDISQNWLNIRKRPSSISFKISSSMTYKKFRQLAWTVNFLLPSNSQ